MLTLISLLLLIVKNGEGQIAANSIRDFVGQLTNLINQNGGLNSLTQQNRPQYPQYPNPESQYPQYLPSYQPHQPYPIAPPYAPQNTGFLNALASIARYDDLKCVPRLLCEVTSGGKPGYVGTDQSVVPLTNKDSLIALLTVLNFIDDSPLLVFGRAALLGYTSRGNSRACLNAYPTCPRDPDALVDYLNNHNGGFFRFFSGQPQTQVAHPQYHHPTPYPSRPYEPDYHRPYKPYRYAGMYTGNNYYQERIQVRPQKIYAPYNPPLYQNSYYGYYGYRDRDSKQLQFPKDDKDQTNLNPVNFFPDRTGTGKLLLDNKGVYYASTENYINFRDQRSIKSIKFPTQMNFPTV